MYYIILQIKIKNNFVHFLNFQIWRKKNHLTISRSRIKNFVSFFSHQKKKFSCSSDFGTITFPLARGTKEKGKKEEKKKWKIKKKNQRKKVVYNFIIDWFFSKVPKFIS